MSTLAEVHLWGRRIGAVELPTDQEVAVFEYEPAFTGSGVEVAPITMPLEAGRRYSYPGLSSRSFRGLPGLLADSLPDRYGNALIDAWLATQGRTPESFNAVERLCYIGGRGMGALEFVPALGPRPTKSHVIDIEALVELSAEVLDQRSGLAVSLKGTKKEQALREILRVGSSAGGARPKALIALNPKTNEVRSGQLDADPGFEHWILKFDGVDDKTRDFGTAQGYGVVEWVYSRMAKLAGIEMTECRLLEEGSRTHFMTRRFDRLDDGSRLHLQSLGALAHLDYNQAGAHSYEEAFLAIRQLGLPMTAVEQQFRRMVFNVIARNQDDHVKNIAFLMDRGGEWRLSPAFDLTYAYNPTGPWTAEHQMSLNGKGDNFTLEDLRQVANTASMKRGRAEEILSEVIAAVKAWPGLAASAGVEADRVDKIERTHRLQLPAA
ncbi:MAG TPA: type II toxin-antitoxin system HipA family toxin [Solirubrobacterales bacterium]